MEATQHAHSSERDVVNRLALLTDSTSDPRPTERSFGVSVGTVLCAFGGLAWWRGHAQALPVFGVAGGMLVLAALLLPGVLRIPNAIWWRFAQVLAWINTRIILTLSFLLVLTPVGYVMRLLGRNPLKSSSRKSTWTAYPGGRRNSTHYEHLF
jgi:hypothetical protein